MLALLWLAGCQTGAQHDLIVRELRKQEDQIYAMEDYLAQYQQLVCQYRAENAALRRQLSEMGVEAELPAPATPSPPPQDKRPPQNGPSAPRPSTPRTNGTRPKPEIQLPDVPPLEPSSQDGQLDPVRGPGPFASPQPLDRVLPATVVELIEPEAPKQVRLRGHVVENVLRGHRIWVEVQALDAAGTPLEFDGQLSLMLLASDGEGRQQQLGRWDFQREDVQAALDATSGDHTMNFHLQLPAGVELTDSTELWARLLPGEGGKLLAHVGLEFGQQPEGTDFPEAASQHIASADEADRPANQNRSLASSPVEHELVDAGWVTARPNHLPSAPAHAGTGMADWRPTSEPLPTATITTASPRRLSSVTRSKTTSDNPHHATTPNRKPVAWTPDRPDEETPSPRTATAPLRPHWTPTR